MFSNHLGATHRGERGSRSETGVEMDEIEITINNDIAANELIPELQTARERKGFMTLEGHEASTPISILPRRLEVDWVSSVVMEIRVITSMFVRQLPGSAATVQGSDLGNLKIGGSLHSRSTLQLHPQCNYSGGGYMMTVRCYLMFSLVKPHGSESDAVASPLASLQDGSLQRCGIKNSGSRAVWWLIEKVWVLCVTKNQSCF